MPLQALGAVTFNVLAKREGVVDPAAVTRLTLVGGLFGLSPIGIVVGQQLARREAAAEAEAAGTGGDTAPAQVQVPDVSKQTYEQAAAMLSSLGLTPVPNLVTSPALPKGQVISTEPPANSLVSSGSTVAVNVSQGVVVPDVTNLQVKDARIKLTNAFLQIDAPSAKDDDVVASQAPAPKTFASAGDKVTVTVAPTPIKK